MSPLTLTLSIDEFLRDPQEIVLLQRHGHTGRSGATGPTESSLLRAIRDVLRDRSLSASLRLAIGGLTVRLSLRDLYHHEGSLCRIVFLNEAQAEQRKVFSDPPEELLLQVGGWLASRAYSTAPEGLRLYYHVVADDGPDAEIRESWHRKFPLGADSLIHDAVVNRMWRLHAAFSQADQALPSVKSVEGNPDQPDPSDRTSLGA